MGLYIRPASSVSGQGRKIDFKPSKTETESQLQPGERLAVVAHRAHGDVALLIDSDGDFHAARGTAPADLVGLYAISEDIARTAS